jgi:hypothetical protein
MKGRGISKLDASQLQSPPLFVKNDVKSFTHRERVWGTMHRNEFSIVVCARRDGLQTAKTGETFEHSSREGSFTGVTL